AVSAVNADASATRTITDYNADGSVKDSSVTTTSADGRTVRTARDADGDGTIDQIQTNVTGIDGSEVETIVDYKAPGVVADKATVTISADRLTTTTQWDFDGNGTIDRTRTDVSVRNIDGSTTETIIDLNSDGTLHQKSVLTVSADGLSKMLNEQGKGYFNVTEVATIGVD